MSALLLSRFPATETADQELAGRIKRQLAADSRAVWQLQIDVADGVVTLRGTANSFYQKQLWLHGTKRAIGNEATINDEIAVSVNWEDGDCAWRD